MTLAAHRPNPWLASPAVIESITPEGPGMATYHFRFSDRQLHDGYRYQPGQFNMVYLPGFGEVAISLSGGEGGRGTWDHTIRVAGDTTRTLAGLPAGSMLGLRGPYGSAWPLDELRGADVVLIAGGIGLAPLRPAIESLLARRREFGRLVLIVGAREPELMLYPRSFAAWAARGMEVQTTVDRATEAWQENVGVVTLLLDRLQPRPRPDTGLLMCGPEVMMRYCVRSALRLGLNEQRMWVSLERNMQCAVGLCGHCQLGPAFVCKQGPVFRHDRIAPFLSVEDL